MEKQTEKLRLPQITIIPDDGTFDFLKGKDFFAKKNARAKEMLSKMTIPEGLGSK